MSASLNRFFRRKAFWINIPRNNDFGVACVATPNTRPVVFGSSFALKYRFVTVVVAFYAKPMRWFGAVHGWLGDIGKRSGSDAFEAVCLLAAVPFFQASNFCFKRAYTFQQFYLAEVGRKCAALGGKDYSVEFSNLVFDDLSIAETYERRRDFASRLKRANQSGDLSSVNHSAALPQTGLKTATEQNGGAVEHG